MRTRAAIAALSLSLGAMLVFLFVSPGDREEVSQPASPREDAPTPSFVEPPRPLPAPEETSLGDGGWKPKPPDSGPIIPAGAEMTQWRSLDIPVEIHSNDGQIAGAWACATQAFDDAPLTSVRFRERQGSSERSGTMTLRISYPDAVDDSSRFYVMAYHPHVGFGVEELAFTELRRLSEGTEPFEIYLEPGESIEGRVIDEHGHPIPGARIAAFMRSDSMINQSGLHTFSNEFGDFVLRGVSLENRPHQILASVEVDVSDALMPGGRRPPRRTVDERVGEESFDPEGGVWKVGEITLPSTAVVRLEPVSEESGEAASDGEERASR